MTKKLILFTIIMLLFSFVIYPKIAHAGNITSLNDIQSRTHINSDSNHTITFTVPTGVAISETMSVIFPSDFSTTNVDYTDIDITDDGGDLTLADLPAGGTWGVAFGGAGNLTLTITSGTGTIAGGSAIIIEIGTNATTGDQAINNPIVAGNYTLTINSGNLTDSGQIGLAIMNEDQIVVNGQVDPTISMLINDLQIGFGHFTNTNIRYATADETGAFAEPVNGQPTQITVSTNAANGATVSARSEGNGTNPGLWFAGGSELIPAAKSSEVLANSKKYGLYVKNAVLLTINAGFDDNSVADLALTRSAQDIASSASAVDTGTLDISLKAAINGETKAGQYADTLTIICTAHY